MVGGGELRSIRIILVGCSLRALKDGLQPLNGLAVQYNNTVSLAQRKPRRGYSSIRREMAFSRAIGLAASAPSPHLLGLRIRASAGGRSPAEDFPPLAGVLCRRLFAGAGAASLVAVGANFGGLTSFLLGFSPKTARQLRLDVLYPVEGFTRCYDPDRGFEFIFPENWVGDQTLLYRAVSIAESHRSLDPPPLGGGTSFSRISDGSNEPAVAFGPPGSSRELNVSVIISSVPPDFSIEAFGNPKEVGKSVLRKIAASRRGPDVRASLLDATLRQDPSMAVNYYKLEFAVESPSFCRHNVAVCTAHGGKLFTMNAQAPESSWSAVREVFCKIADSFNLVDA